MLPVPGSRYAITNISQRYRAQRRAQLSPAARSESSLRLADEAGAVRSADVHAQESRSRIVVAVQLGGVERDTATVERTDERVRVLLVV
jgi:hypothetical protein